MNNYALTLFAIRYEYIVFNFGRVTVSKVPIQSSYQRASEEPINTGASNSGIKNEIPRRYVKEVPYLYNQSLGKKKWSGLEGDFFNEQKRKDLGKTIEKKKDIFKIKLTSLI